MHVRPSIYELGERCEEYLKKGEVMITEGELKSAEIVSIETESVDIGVVVVQVIAFHIRDFEQEEGSEEADKEISMSK